MRVMVVDDEWDILDLVTEELRRSGHEVIGLNNPRSAMDVLKLSCNRFDLLICDLVMPQTNGLDFAKQVLQLEHFKGEVAFMSGYTDALDQDIQAMGVRFVLRKPFSREHLHRLLRAVTPDSGATKTL